MRRRDHHVAGTGSCRTTASRYSRNPAAASVETGCTNRMTARVPQVGLEKASCQFLRTSPGAPSGRHRLVPKSPRALGTEMTMPHSLTARAHGTTGAMIAFGAACVAVTLLAAFLTVLRLLF